MDNLSDTQHRKTGSIFGASCEAAAKFPEYITDDETSDLSETCRHNRELYPRCKDEEIGLFLAEVDGLDLHTVKNISGPSMRLPAFIPIADDKFFNDEIDIGGGLIIIQLRDILRKRPVSVLTNLCDSRLFKDRRVILSSSGPDREIEWAWWERDKLNLFEKMAGMRLVAAMPFNFSVYDCMCPFAQHFNIKRSLKSGSLMETAGTPCIPHVYAITKNQQSRIVQWLNKNPQISTISINCQLQKAGYHLNVLDESIRYMLKNCNRELHIVLEGYQIPNLVNLFEWMPYLHVAQKQPFMDGLNFTQTTFDRNSERLVQQQVKIPYEDRATLVAQSIRARRAYIAHLHKKYKNAFQLNKKVSPVYVFSNGKITSNAKI
jgi:hypothetical protein